jgi:hypothetical protein
MVDMGSEKRVAATRFLTLMTVQANVQLQAKVPLLAFASAGSSS